MQIEITPLGKFIFILIVIVILAIAIYLVARKIKRLWRGHELIGIDKKEIARRWGEIEKMLEGSGEMNYKMAVMEADKILDQVLKFMYFPGSTMGERLKVACYKYQDLRHVWWAHKIRNQLVHEASYNLNQRTAKRAIDDFKRALKELGVL